MNSSSGAAAGAAGPAPELVVCGSRLPVFGASPEGKESGKESKPRRAARSDKKKVSKKEKKGAAARGGGGGAVWLPVPATFRFHADKSTHPGDYDDDYRTLALRSDGTFTDYYEVVSIITPAHACTRVHACPRCIPVCYPLCTAKPCAS